MDANNQKLVGGALCLAVLAIIAFLAWNALNAPDRRGVGERLDDAAGELTKSDDRGIGKKIDDATDQLGDRTPAEKIGDGVRDVGHDISNTINNTVR